MDAIYENSHSFLVENQSEIGTIAGAFRMLNDEAMFRDYLEALTESLPSVDIANVVRTVANRQRLMLLENTSSIMETSNVMGSASPIGWILSAFPILVDIYAEPIIAEVANVYPVDKPEITVPRMRGKATIRGYDGTSIEETYIPTPTKTVRAGLVEVTVTPDTLTNIFTSIGFDPGKMKMNKRYTIMSKMYIVEKDPSGTTVGNYPVEVSFRPDGRNQIARETGFENTLGELIKAHVSGNVAYDKGTIQFHVNFDGGAQGHTYECSYSTFNLAFTPYRTMDGRTSIGLENEATDIVIEKNEDFLLELTEEEMQDYSAIFKIDLVKVIGELIKRQMLLNKDNDLSYFLKASEAEMRQYGAYQVLDLEKYSAAGGAGEYTPASVMDVMKSLVPRVSTLMSIIRKNYNMYPSYLIAGLRTASMLRSMQDMMAVNLPTLRGEIGFSGATAQFMKLKILEAVTIDDNKIYMTTKAPSDGLERSSIVDFIFQPLYIVRETTDGNLRHFVRSRTALEILRTDGMGYIEVKNITPYVGSI